MQVKDGMHLLDAMQVIDSKQWIDGMKVIVGMQALHLHMGWLRSVGSIKLQVSFAEYRLFYRSLWQKRPII